MEKYKRKFKEDSMRYLNSIPKDELDEIKRLAKIWNRTGEDEDYEKVENLLLAWVKDPDDVNDIISRL